MSNPQNLYETLDAKANQLNLEFPEIPEYINDNLKYEFFDWQKEAFENFLIYQRIKEEEDPNTSQHLMFNMATGTGKTLLMASLILYYFKQGYRHFIFFVNQNNIIDKTENNFIDSLHSKYLFKQKIVIDDRVVQIKKVDEFSDDPKGIEIKFTSIQKLYNDIHTEREYQMTLGDLHKMNIVMLADEAHHLNTDTRCKAIDPMPFDTEITAKTSESDIEKKGWEHAVIDLVLNKNNKGIRNKNVLLEFTATIPSNKNVVEKYRDKIIYTFGLKEFLKAGYTKEINLISSTLEKKERVLQALFFQWYRHKIALENNIANFKPVILFRSKTINESKEDHDNFLEWTQDIVAQDLDFIERISCEILQGDTPNEQGGLRTEQALRFMKSKGIKFREIANWIKQNYTDRSTIITNSKTNKTKTEKTDEETEKLLNSLEDKSNNIRAIFTVDRLTEGWDVLNLFDIVRMYEGQNANVGTRKTPDATIKEKQLIGRGVRYYPFNYNGKKANKRRLDDKTNEELRILEELFYYTHDEESKYITHIKNELKKDGFIIDKKDAKAVKTDSFRKRRASANKQAKNPDQTKMSMADFMNGFEYKVSNLEVKEERMSFDKTDNSVPKNTPKTVSICIKIKDIERHIFLKAVNVKAIQDGSPFQFDKLKEILGIESVDDLYSKILADFEIKIIATQKYDDLENKIILDMTLKFLENFKRYLLSIKPK